LFLGQTTSLCEHCNALVPAKILEQSGAIYYQKRCAIHGVQKTLISTDPAYWRSCREFIKPGDRPLRPQTHTERGCPWDCGLCPDHEQHSCVALIEITDQCNLQCPVCYADSAPGHGGHRSLDEVYSMLATIVASEGEPDVVQISGGEPTEHPEILEILRRAKASPIRHLMINTNGVRIANDREFVRKLAELSPGFEVYLQFDALDDAGLQQIRGANLSAVRRRALDNLEQAGISTTLVVTVKRGVNDDAVADILDFARDWACVRGVNYQPIQHAGRNPSFDKDRDRVLLSDIRRRLIEASGVFAEQDIIPLPCNPEYIAIGYAIRNGRELTPITTLLPREEFIGSAPNSIAFEKHPELKKRLFDLLSLSSSPQNTSERLANLLCCLPSWPVPDRIGYEHVFRVSIVQFLDRFNFCLGGVKRSCIHIVQPDGRVIPFDTFNLFYRQPMDKTS
jgi:uncharacterized radical SAM superfamily Fe-S cluster-containing enzyme